MLCYTRPDTMLHNAGICYLSIALGACPGAPKLSFHFYILKSLFAI